MLRICILVLALLAFTAGSAFARDEGDTGTQSSTTATSNSQGTQSSDASTSSNSGSATTSQTDQTPGTGSTSQTSQSSGSNNSGGGGGGGINLSALNPLNWISPENISKAFGGLINKLVITPAADVIHSQIMGFMCGNIWTYTDPKCTYDWDVVQPFIDKAVGFPLIFVIWFAYVSHLFKMPQKRRSAVEKAEYRQEVWWFAIAALLAFNIKEVLAPAAITAVNFLDAQMPQVDIGALIPSSDALTSGMSPEAMLLTGGFFTFVAELLEWFFIGVLFGIILLRWIAIIVGLVFAGPILAGLAHKRVRVNIEQIFWAYMGILFVQPVYVFCLALLVELKKAIPQSQAFAGAVVLALGIWLVVNLIWASKNFLRTKPFERILVPAKARGF